MKKMRLLFILFISVISLTLFGCDFSNIVDKDDDKTLTDILPPQTTYTLRVFTNEGGDVNIKQKEYNAGELVELWAIASEGYVVDGWYSDDKYLLSSKDTYTFTIYKDTLIELRFVEQVDTAIDEEMVQESELSGVSDGFVILVKCEETNAKEYIKENLKIYDEYFLDDDNVPFEGYEDIAEVELGNIVEYDVNMYLVYAKEDYSRTAAYVIQSDENIQVFKKGSMMISDNKPINLASSSNGNAYGEDGDFTFVIDSNKSSILELADDVLIFATEDNCNATTNNVDGFIYDVVGEGYTIYDEDYDEELIGGFTCDYESVSKLSIGSKVVFGGNVVKQSDDMLNLDHTTLDTVFGVVTSIRPIGEVEEYAIYFVEVNLTDEPEDFFENVDLSINQAIDLDDAEFVDDLEEATIEALMHNEEFIAFSAAVHTAAEKFNEVQPLGSKIDLGSFTITHKNWTLDISFEIQGKSLTVRVKGTNKHELIDGLVAGDRVSGELIVSFELVQRFEFDADVTWLYRYKNGMEVKKGIETKLHITSTSTFSFGVEVEGTFSSSSYVASSKEMRVHRPWCKHCDKILPQNKIELTGTLYELAQKGYVPCLDCLDYRSDNSSENDNSVIKEHYNKLIRETLKGRDFKSIQNELDDLYSEHGDSEAEIEVCSVPFCIGSIKFSLDVYIYFSFEINAGVDVSVTSSSTATIGFRATLKSFKLIYETKTNFSNLSIDFTGSVKVEIGVKVALTAKAPVGNLKAKIYAKIYPYIDLSGIIHIEDDEAPLVAGLVEAGLGIKVGAEVNLLNIIKYKMPNLLNKEFPIMKWGYDTVLLDFYEISDVYSLSQSEEIITLEDLKVDHIQILDVNNLKQIYDIVDLTNPAYHVEILIVDPANSWFELIEYKGLPAIRVKDGAPYEKQFSSEIVIEITATNEKLPFGKYQEDSVSVNLPILHITLIGEKECLEHDFKLVPRLEPTCEETGIGEYAKCSKCGKEVTADLARELKNKVIIPALNHDYVQVEAKASTCSTAGHSAWEYCVRCGKMSVEKIEYPLAQHSESDWILDALNMPTCTRIGKEYKLCEYADCILENKVIRERDVLPTGHIIDLDHSSPTCTEDVVCKTCKEVLAKALGHLWDEGLITIPPTCTSIGEIKYQCSLCFEIKTEELEMLPHDIIEVNRVPETCNDNGMEAHYNCESCNKLFLLNNEIYEEVDELELIIPASHKWQDATCLVPQICTSCGQTNGEALGHAYDSVKYEWSEDYSECTATRICLRDSSHVETETVESVYTHQDATEEENGFDKYVAEFENPAFAKQSHETIIPVLGHTHNYGEEVPEVAATCTTSGVEAHYLCRCGQYFQLFKGEYVNVSEELLIIQALGHDYGNEIEAVAATCTTTGTKAHYVCNRCSNFYELINNLYVEVSEEDLVVAATGHTYGKLIAKVAATCLLDGMEAHYKCSDCNTLFQLNNYEYEEVSEAELVIPSTGHTYGPMIPETAATCTEDGKEAHYRCVCGKLFQIFKGEYVEVSKDELVIPKSHKEVEIEYLAATCTETGHFGGIKCSECNEILVNPTIISATGHSFGPAEVIRESTCNTQGIIEKVCLHNCGEKEIEYLPICHNLDEYNKCKNPECDKYEEYIYTVGLQFELIDGKYYVSGFNGETNETQLLIPAKYNNIEVVGIKNNALANTKFRTVKLPLGLKVIEDNSFINCNNLAEINIPKSVVLMGKYIFNNCDELTRINLSTDVKWYRNLVEFNNISQEENATELIKDSSIYQLFTITYKDADGNVLVVQQYKYNEVINIYIPDKPIFIGWDNEIPNNMPAYNIEVNEIPKVEVNEIVNKTYDGSLEAVARSFFDAFKVSDVGIISYKINELFGYSKEELIAQGYTTIKIDLSFTATRTKYGAPGEIYISNSKSQSQIESFDVNYTNNSIFNTLGNSITSSASGTLSFNINELTSDNIYLIFTSLLVVDNQAGYCTYKNIEMTFTLS